MKRRYVDADTGAYVNVRRDVHGGSAHWLTKVYCPPRYRGEQGATRCIRAVCDDADREGIDLRLMVIPVPATEVRRRLLREFYRRFGFRGTEEMVRECL